jgi:hypothetical protein
MRVTTSRSFEWQQPFSSSAGGSDADSKVAGPVLQASSAPEKRRDVVPVDLGPTIEDRHREQAGRIDALIFGGLVLCSNVFLAATRLAASAVWIVQRVRIFLIIADPETSEV